jgi:TPR repeat protein
MREFLDRSADTPLSEAQMSATPALYFSQGSLAVNKKEWDKAISYYRKAILLDDSYALPMTTWDSSTKQSTPTPRRCKSIRTTKMLFTTCPSSIWRAGKMLKHGRSYRASSHGIKAGDTKFER